MQFWDMGPTAAALGLRAQGFSIRQAARLVTLKLRYLRGDYRELTDEQKRLLFVRWLVQHGWFAGDLPVLTVALTGVEHDRYNAQLAR